MGKFEIFTFAGIAAFLWFVLSASCDIKNDRQIFCSKFDMTSKEFHTNFLCIDGNGIAHDPDVMNKIN